MVDRERPNVQARLAELDHLKTQVVPELTSRVHALELTAAEDAAKLQAAQKTAADDAITIRQLRDELVRVS